MATERLDLVARPASASAVPVEEGLEAWRGDGCSAPLAEFTHPGEAGRE